MNQSISYLSQLAIIEQIDQLKAEIDQLRPLSREQEGRIMQKFRLDWNYHSNAIEGNSLNYGETVAFLMHGITAKGKPFKDYLDIKGHNEAIDFLLPMVRDNEDLTEKDIRSLHQLLLKEPYEVKAQTPDGYPTTKTIVPGRYKTSPNHVQTATGEIHYYASVEETPIKMQELMDWYRAAKDDSTVHPVVLAALFHHRFVAIHPFDDGNGRMTRLLMNLMLMQVHYPPVVIKQQNRGAYYLALSLADTGNVQPFVEFIAENLVYSLELYLKGARGESLEEPSDLDKELALFKKELLGDRNYIEVERSLEAQKKLYKESLQPMLAQIRSTVGKFRDLFLSYTEGSLNATFEGGEGINPSFSFSHFNEIDYQIEYLLHTTERFSEFSFSLLLSYFKQENNAFSIKTIIKFRLEPYFYSAHFRVNDGDNYFSLRKKYTRSFSDQEVQQIADYIGKQLLMHIKLMTERD